MFYACSCVFMRGTTKRAADPKQIGARQAGEEEL